MRFKIFLLIPILSLLFAVSARAEITDNPYYTVEGMYNEEDMTYTVNVYLNTDYYLAAGSFGMEFDENVPLVWQEETDTQNAGYMRLNTELFIPMESSAIIENEAEFRDKHIILLQWGVKELDAENPIRGKLLLGSFTIDGAVLGDDGNIQGWSDEPFRQLDWLTTDISKTELFTRSDEGYQSLNEEIWNDDTKLYQGFVFYTDDTKEQVDIGFEYISGLEADMKITGTLEGYNPKFIPSIYAYRDEKVYEGTITGYVIRADGYTIYTYEIPIPKSGSYTIAYQKQSHLTYLTETEAVEKETALPTIKLLCGDINGDGSIKYPDRAELIRFLNRQKAWTENVTQFNKSDLNGDGLVNLFDLNILKANLNKTYNSR